MINNNYIFITYLREIISLIIARLPLIDDSSRIARFFKIKRAIFAELASLVAMR